MPGGALSAHELALHGRTVVVRTTEGDPALPLVVLLHGTGSRAGAWDDVRRRVDGRIATVAYDRTGRPDRRRPVTADELASDLADMLRAGCWRPPYLLVGHSWGGVVARAFAQAAPADVAGLVLVDATHEALASLHSRRFRLAEQAARIASRLPVSGGPLMATARELAGLRASLRQLTLPAVPTWTIVGGHASSAAQQAVRQDFVDTYRRLADSSPLVRHLTVTAAGHDLPVSAPDAVVKVLEVALALVDEGIRP